MGNKNCCGKKRKLKKIVLLLVGLDNAGKSVTARNLAGEWLNGDSDLPPTVGFSVIKLKFKKFGVDVYDLGGGSNIRQIWKQYFVDAHGVIFVVDSSDFERLDEVHAELVEVLGDEKVMGKPVLLLANKQDHDDALDEIDLVERLQLERLVNQAQCPTLVETCCARDVRSSTMDRGIENGYQWIVNFVIKNFEKLNQRVSSDVATQRAHLDRERQVRIARIKARAAATSPAENLDKIELYSEYSAKNPAIVRSAVDDILIVAEAGDDATHDSQLSTVRTEDLPALSTPTLSATSTTVRHATTTSSSEDEHPPGRCRPQPKTSNTAKSIRDNQAQHQQSQSSQQQPQRPMSAASAVSRQLSMHRNNVGPYLTSKTSADRGVIGDIATRISSAPIYKLRRNNKTVPAAHFYGPPPVAQHGHKLVRPLSTSHGGGDDTVYNNTTVLIAPSGRGASSVSQVQTLTNDHDGAGDWSRLFQWSKSERSRSAGNKPNHIAMRNGQTMFSIANGTNHIDVLTLESF